VKVGNDDPGPQRMSACSPVEGIDMAWGILRTALADGRPIDVMCAQFLGQRAFRSNRPVRRVLGVLGVRDRLRRDVFRKLIRSRFKSQES
jgi:hypothetical protein